MVMNFFDPQSVIYAFCEHFSIDNAFFHKVCLSFDSVHNSAVDFAREIGADLLVPTIDCEIICRHITTCADNLASVKKHGMLTLDRLLVNDTPLSKFLSSYGIIIDPNQSKMTIRNKRYHINGWEDSCQPCVSKHAVKILPNSFGCCDYHEKMALLHNKLYHDKGEVEVYASGSDENMLAEYTSIQYGPEVLFTIGEIIKTIIPKTKDNFLQYAWAEQSGIKRYILVFRVPLDAIETNTEHKSRTCFYDDSDWFEYSGFEADDYFEDRIPMSFFRNKLLIELAYASIFCSFENSYLQIIPSFQISPDRISIWREMSLDDIV